MLHHFHTVDCFCYLHLKKETTTGAVIKMLLLSAVGNIWITHSRDCTGLIVCPDEWKIDLGNLYDISEYEGCGHFTAVFCFSILCNIYDVYVLFKLSCVTGVMCSKVWKINTFIISWILLIVVFSTPQQKVSLCWWILKVHWTTGSHKLPLIRALFCSYLRPKVLWMHTVMGHVCHNYGQKTLLFTPHHNTFTDDCNCTKVIFKLNTGLRIIVYIYMDTRNQRERRAEKW